MEALALYGRLAGAQVRSQMQYRLSFALDTTATFLGTIVDFLAVWVFFGHTATLGGWTLPEVGLLYGLSSLSFGLADMLASGFDHAYFGPTMIRQGYFDQVLVRPVSPFLQVLASQVVPRRLGRFLQGALILAIALPLLGLDWTGPKLAFAGLTVLGGLALFFGLFVLGAAASFWTIESLEGMNVLTYGGQMISSYPMSIFQPWLRGFFTFVIPMACVNYYPALWLLGKPDPLGLPTLPLALLSAPICALACGLCVALWWVGVRHYQSTGS